MKTTITAQEKNPFLEREEFVISIEHESAPTKEAIIADLGKDAELTVVRKIDTNFGKQTFTADVVVYDSKESKDKHMTIPQKVRKKMEEERKAKEAEEKKKKEEEAKAAEEAAKAAEEAKKAEAAEAEGSSDEGETKAEESSEDKSEEKTE